MGATDCPLSSATLSTLPISLTGTLVNDNPRDSTAAFFDVGNSSTRSYRVGEAIVGSAQLILVASDRAYLQRDDKLEYVPLTTTPGTANEQAMMTEAPDTVLTLHLSGVNAALEEREKLDAMLATGSLNLEGKRLLKLKEVAPGGFYDLLGLQSQDVLMQVDGQWVHNKKNPLWTALSTQKQVTLVIMRNGFPRKFLYLVIEN